MPKICNRFNKNCFKESNSKSAEATGALIGNKTADKIASASKNLHSKTDENEIKTPKERYIFPERHLLK